MANKTIMAISDGQPVPLTSGDKPTDGGGNILNKTRTEHSWAIYDELTDDTYPGMFVDVPSGKTAKITQMRYKIASGTSVSLTLVKNGTDVTSPDYDELSCTTSVTETALDLTLSDNDYLELKLTDSTGTPTSLMCTFVIEKY